MAKATLSQENKLAAWVEEALRVNRDGSLVELGRVELAFSSLVEDCFLAGEEIDERRRGQVVQAVLRWGVEQLRPEGEHSWMDERWESYNVLFYPYFNKMTFSTLIKKTSTTRTNIYRTWRPRALEALAKVLGKELKAPQVLEQRQGYVIQVRYEAYKAHEQEILRMAALFRRPFAASLLDEVEQEKKQQGIANLVQANLLRSHQEGSRIELHPNLRPYLLTLLSPEERLKWHEKAAESYEAQEDYLEAAYHWRMRGDKEANKRAAQTLIEHQQRIIDRLESERLRDVLDSFESHQLPDEFWVQIKLLSGDLALEAKEIEVALEEYRAALSAHDVPTRALAYYKRAKAFVNINLDQAQIHYEEGIRLLTNSCPQDDILLSIYIDYAWLFIHERPNHARAEAILKEAEGNIGNNPVRKARLYNASAGLYAKQKDHEHHEQIIQHRLKALTYAEQAQHIELMMKCTKNLAFDYAQLRQDYENGLKYAHQSLEIAIKADSLQLQGSSLRTIGNCYFWQQSYDKALEYYHQAYQIFLDINNQNRQIVTCYDLTEAYAEIGKLVKMEYFYEQGRKLAQEIGHDEYVAEFDKLPLRYPELDPTLNKRLQQAFPYVRQHKQITSRAHRKLTGITAKTASRDLNKLVKKGLLIKKGAGAGTHYTFPAAS